MDYRSIIESRYNRQNWQELLYDIFRQKVQFWQQPQLVPVDESMAKRALFTGKITLPDGHIIAIYEVELSDSVIIERNRAGIRNLLCTNWRGMGCSGAFMFCFRQNEAVLRFSYVSEAFTFTEDGGIKKESTDTKRFTYLLGEGHRSRTAIQQFEKLKASGLTLKDVTKAFSVEALSDLFFKEYKKQYEDIIALITDKRMVKIGNKWEERKDDIIPESDKEYGNIILREFAHFPDAEKAVRDYVKKLMGRLVFIQFLQKKGWMGCSAGEAWNDGDREFVQNLFANTTHKNTFVDDVLEPLFADINTKRTGDIASSPNVGTGIKIPYLNGGLFEHDDYDKTAFPLPAKYMKSLLDFFASYNFTIDENDPDDAEIGVDPEMLGRIFENLLEDNKDKGAFYTPKEIVQYMCRESLIAYLQTDVEDDAVKLHIREFVITNNADLLSADLAASIDQKLKDVKICDPAIGSGAFPMGLLRELYACRKAIEGIDNDNAVHIKTHIIQNNIYGVDIEKGAVDIARLRFWLALIVDEKTPHALPNMDFKIMQGNSLLEQYEGVELSGMSLNEQEKRRSRKKKEQAWQQTLAFDEESALDNIQNAIREYYGTDDHRQKTELRNIINSNVKSYILNLKGCTPDIQRRLENLPIPNDQFFLWHIYFKEVFDKGGFDIVIGNPPYVNIANIKEKTYRDELKRQFIITKNKCDLYAYFIEKSYSLLSQHGILSFIIPETWKATDSFSLLRKLIIDNHSISLIVNLKMGVFDAIVRPMIIIMNNTKYSDYNFPVYDGLFDFKYNVNLEEITNTKDYRIDTESTSAEKMIFKKVEKAEKRLSDILCFSRGIKTSDDKRFIHKEALTEDHKKVYRGRNIKAYTLNWEDEYVWYRPDLMKEKVGCLPHSVEFFEVPEKLVTQRVNSSMQLLVTYDDNKNFFLDTTNVSNYKTWDKTYSMKFLCGMLNSRIVNFWYSRKYRMPTIGGYELESIPIPDTDIISQQPIITLVDRILSAKKANPLADTTAEEREIDRLVYDLYGLTEDEIAIVEGTE